MKLLSIFKTPVIEFFAEADFYGVVPEPAHASKFVPEWFKRIAPFLKNERDKQQRPAMSAKKCMPMLDAMTMGFTIPLPADQHLRTNHDCSIIEVGPTSTVFPPVVERHSAKQVGGAFGKQDPIKFINPWVIKTAPGWSCLIIPPLNSMEDRFRCLSALVDTDKYPKQINFPAQWLRPNFDDFLPAGTPLVTVIPIKRSSLQREAPVRLMTESEQDHIRRIRTAQETRLHVYTNELREDK